jgi:signal peptidase II
MTMSVTGSTGSAGQTSGLVWLPLAALVIGLDQLVKWLVVSHLAPYQSVPVLPPVLDFTLIYNTGAAFSFLDGASGWQSGLFIVFALIFSTAIVLWLKGTQGRSQAVLAVSGVLVLGGALGNAVDRLRAGHVVDFIDAHWNGHHFWTFNVADSAITVGVVIYLALQLMRARAEGERR